MMSLNVQLIISVWGGGITVVIVALHLHLSVCTVGVYFIFHTCVSAPCRFPSHCEHGMSRVVSNWLPSSVSFEVGRYLPSLENRVGLFKIQSAGLKAVWPALI